ncbi:hypothetical protein FLK61_23720 [Paenalkalicoccus suaedae]|uniref:EamA domain-containing protein n=1 Tax=Paenalkalicoccus suaedae TaxID=2592382 RepID=A0A859FAK7_9BACI|nr:hypothetical protein [Paenalkalicoccus suaedae]QKS69802.1 hypothetical protein FLK61_23720 [Paenalkalicoccus suaedae]
MSPTVFTILLVVVFFACNFLFSFFNKSATRRLKDSKLGIVSAVVGYMAIFIGGSVALYQGFEPGEDALPPGVLTLLVAFVLALQTALDYLFIKKDARKLAVGGVGIVLIAILYAFS